MIYAVAPSYQDANTIWVGTDDGLIHLTRDGGKSWYDITPPQLTPWSKVSIIEASRTDAATAYAAINRFRLDDLRAHIYRTRDYGKSWAEITKGLPDNAPVNVVREDPVRKGLLYAGTETSVYVSFDDGDNWQPLQLNLPHTSMRDLTIHGDDLIVATHGRSFWILDDVTPLRQLTETFSTKKDFLFAPQTAIRFRWSRYPDTPLPPETPAGQNPPDGAIIDYYLAPHAGSSSGPVVLEIFDEQNHLVRRYSSDDKPQDMQKIAASSTIRDRVGCAPGEKFFLLQLGMHRFPWRRFALHTKPERALALSFTSSPSCTHSPQGTSFRVRSRFPESIPSKLPSAAARGIRMVMRNRWSSKWIRASNLQALIWRSNSPWNPLR